MKKHKKWIAIIFGTIFILIVVIGIIYISMIDRYEAGLKFMESENWISAKAQLEMINKDNSNYEKAQEILSIISFKVDSINKARETIREIEKAKEDSLRKIELEKQELAKLKSPNYRRDLEIVNSSWKSGIVSTDWAIRVKNKSKYITYKDMKFKTKYYSESDTEIDESILGHTEYVILKPGRTKRIKFIELFVHSQAKKASISIDNAEVVN